MTDSEQSPLEHFVKGRGRQYLEFKTLKAKTLKMAAGSFAMILVVPAMISLSMVLTTGKSLGVEIAVACSSIFIGGGIVSHIGARQVRRTLRGAMGERSEDLTLPNGVGVTPQAQEMEMMLLLSYQCKDPAVAEQLRRSKEFARKHKLQAKFLGVKAADDIRAQSQKEVADLPQSVTAALEQAAAQYDRCVTLAQTVPGTGDAVQAVADESMVAVLHWAHRIAKSPESLGEFEPHLWAAAEVLRDLAANIDALTSHAGITPTAGIQDLLEEFRRNPPGPPQT